MGAGCCAHNENIGLPVTPSVAELSGLRVDRLTSLKYVALAMLAFVTSEIVWAPATFRRLAWERAPWSN
jgi:hypothetical protein